MGIDEIHLGSHITARIAPVMWGGSQSAGRSLAAPVIPEAPVRTLFLPCRWPAPGDGLSREAPHQAAGAQRPRTRGNRGTLAMATVSLCCYGPVSFFRQGPRLCFHCPKVTWPPGSVLPCLGVGVDGRHVVSYSHCVSVVKYNALLMNVGLALGAKEGAEYRVGPHLVPQSSPRRLVHRWPRKSRAH